MASAISCSAKIAENGTKHMGHVESKIISDGDFANDGGDVPSSPAAVSSCSVMDGSSDISFFRASLEGIGWERVSLRVYQTRGVWVRR